MTKMSASDGAGTAEHTGEKPELTREVRIDRVTEIILAVMLGAVALATAWSGYQAARWGGVQSIRFSQAGALRTESMRASTRGGQQIQVDIGMFFHWINAFGEGNEALADFYRDRFRDDMVPAFEAWLAADPVNNPDVPATPFELPEYSLYEYEQAEQLELEAEARFEEGRAANQRSDDYVLNAVVLASVLFLAGIASRFDWLPVKLAIIVAALLLLAMALYNIVIYPVA